MIKIIAENKKLLLQCSECAWTWPLADGTHAHTPSTCQAVRVMLPELKKALDYQREKEAMDLAIRQAKKGLSPVAYSGPVTPSQAQASEKMGIAGGYTAQGMDPNRAGKPISEMKPTNPKDVIGSDKLPLHLWPSVASALGSLGMLEGVLKYGRNNFREMGVRSSIYVDACKRHLDAWMEGEETAPDTGTPHLANALACLGIIVDAMANGKLVDDRNFTPHPGLWRTFIDSYCTPHVGRLKKMFSDKSPRHYTIQDNKDRKAIDEQFGVDLSDAQKKFLDMTGAVGAVSFDKLVREDFSAKGAMPHEVILGRPGPLQVPLTYSRFEDTMAQQDHAKPLVRNCNCAICNKKERT